MSDDVEDTRWRTELTSSFGMRRDISTSEVVHTVFQWIGAPSDRLAAAAKHAIAAVARLLPGTKAETTQGAIDALVAGLIEERARATGLERALACTPAGSSDRAWRAEVTRALDFDPDIPASEFVRAVGFWGTSNAVFRHEEERIVAAVCAVLPHLEHPGAASAVEALIEAFKAERAKNEALRAHTAGVVREQIAIALGVGPGASTDELIGVIGHLRGRLAAAEPKAVTIRAKVEIDETALREAVSRVLAERSERGAP